MNPEQASCNKAFLHLGRVRRDRGTSELTKRVRELTGRPGARVDLTAPVYLHRYVPDERARERGGVPGDWRVFANAVDAGSRTGCTAARSMETLYARRRPTGTIRSARTCASR